MLSLLTLIHTQTQGSSIPKSNHYPALNSSINPDPNIAINDTNAIMAKPRSKVVVKRVKKNILSNNNLLSKYKNDDMYNDDDKYDNEQYNKNNMYDNDDLYNNRLENRQDMEERHDRPHRQIFFGKFDTDRDFKHDDKHNERYEDIDLASVRPLAPLES